ncbi:hypothetical protein ACVBEQ_19555 [Nakamurella sp. GG22]
MADQNGAAADRPSGESSPGGRPARPTSSDEQSQNRLDDAPLADRLEVDPERGDVKG